MILFSTSQTPSLDEIVFEHRNRMYGAFILRREYNRRVLCAFTITASLLLLITGTVFYRFVSTHAPSPFMLPVDPVVLDNNIIIEIQETKENKSGTAAGKSQPEQAGSNQHKDDLPPVVVDSVPAVHDTKKDKPADTLTYNQYGKNKPGEVIPGDIPGAGPVNPFPGSGPTVIDVSQFMPEFPGGDKELYRFLGEMLRFPRGKQQSTTVYVSFVVNTDGSIGSVEILHSGGEPYDNEVIRVVNKMPRWKPGRQGDQVVAVRCKMPVSFKVLP